MLYIVFNTSVVLDIPYSLNLHINQPFKEDTDIQGYRDIYKEYRIYIQDTGIQGYLYRMQGYILDTGIYIEVKRIYLRYRGIW